MAPALNLSGAALISAALAPCACGFDLAGSCPRCAGVVARTFSETRPAPAAKSCLCSVCKTAPLIVATAVLHARCESCTAAAHRAIGFPFAWSITSKRGVLLQISAHWYIAVMPGTPGAHLIDGDHYRRVVGRFEAERHEQDHGFGASYDVEQVQQQIGEAYAEAVVLEELARDLVEKRHQGGVLPSTEVAFAQSFRAVGGAK